MEEKLIVAAVNAGVGGLIASLIIYLTYKLVSKLLSDVGNKMVEAFNRQAASMEGLTQSIDNFVNRDNGEHREMLVLLKYIAQRSQSFDDVEREHNERVRNGHQCVTKEPTKLNENP